MTEIVVLTKPQLEEMLQRAASLAAEQVLRAVHKLAKEVMDVEEVAAYLGITSNTVRVKIKTKGLPVREKLDFIKILSLRS